MEETVLAFTSSPQSPSRPRRRSRGPLIALAGAVAVYVALWLLPWRLNPSLGHGTLAILHADERGNVAPLADGGTVPARSRVGFAVSTDHDGSVVVIGLSPPGRAALYSPTAGAPRRIHPGARTVLPDRPALDGVAGTERFVAVFCKAPLPAATVVKAGERALQAAGGDPDAVRTLDLGCAEAFAAVRKVPP
jgi:hypothetical protein